MRNNEKEYHASVRGSADAAMNSQVSGQWVLARELGLEYADRAVFGSSISLLRPVSAERTKAGGHLIVDDELQDRNPPLMQYRTLLLSPQRGVLYDSRAQGIEDAYGCLMNGGQFAVLRRARAEICVHSGSGELIRSIDLSGISKRRPKILCWTSRRSFLVAFVSGRCDLDIVEISEQGHALWSYVDSISMIGIPSSMQLLADRSIIIADEFRHVVWKLEPSGSSTILWGNWHSPSSSPGELHRPRCAQLLGDGTLLIADSSNGRILAVDRAGHASSLHLKNRALLSPSSVRKLKTGSYLVCDAGSQCIFELDSSGKCMPQHGSLQVRKRHLSFPRSVQYLGKNRYMVANTAQNTIIHASQRGIREFQISSKYKLFWPRAARKTKDGTVLIADGRNGAILELSPDGNELRYLKQCRHNKLFITFQDPHDVRLQPNLNLLIVDSPQNLVVETDWNGRAAWVIGLTNGITLSDPHSAQQLSDGRIMISDTRNHRILFVDPVTGSSTSISEVKAGASRCKLCLPRYAEVSPDGTLVIADAGNDRVLITDLDFSFLEVLSGIPGSPIPYLRAPRWVQVKTRDELVVSDHGHHRILHFRRRVREK